MRKMRKMRTERRTERRRRRGRGGPPFLVNIHVMSLGSPGTLANARRLQLADASFRDYNNSVQTANIFFVTTVMTDEGL